MSDKIIHDYKTKLQKLDVFALCRIILTYEQDESSQGQVAVIQGLNNLEGILKQYRKDFRL